MKTQKHDKSVLIIDDEEDLCLLLKNLLRKQSSAVDYALTLRSGLEKVSDLLPDIILLDNNLPDGSGLDQIETIRRLNAPSRILMISAMGHLREKALATGADAFFEKPISLSAIQEWL